MNMHKTRRRRPATWRIATTLVLVVALSGCGLDEVDVPEFDGPSSYGMSVLLTVSRDVLVADGRDFAIVTATVRGPDGRPLANQDVFFVIADEDGNFADIGVIVGQNGPGTGATVRTNTQGVAQVIYEAPARTDATANQTVQILARLVGNHFTGAAGVNGYSAVRIELRSAEPRLFPPVTGNVPPTCSFITEPSAGPFRVGQVIGFHSTSSDSDGVIIRYEWNFGDNTTGDSPDTGKVYRTAGTFAVIHRVIDDDGGLGICTALNIVVQ